MTKNVKQWFIEFVFSVLVGFATAISLYLLLGFFFPLPDDTYLCHLIVKPTVVGLGVGFFITVSSARIFGHKRKLRLPFALLIVAVILAYWLCLQSSAHA